MKLINWNNLSFDIQLSSVIKLKLTKGNGRNRTGISRSIIVHNLNNHVQTLLYINIYSTLTDQLLLKVISWNDSIKDIN